MTKTIIVNGNIKRHNPHEYTIFDEDENYTLYEIGYLNFREDYVLEGKIHHRYVSGDSPEDIDKAIKEVVRKVDFVQWDVMDDDDIKYHPWNQEYKVQHISKKEGLLESMIIDFDQLRDMVSSRDLVLDEVLKEIEEVGFFNVNNPILDEDGNVTTYFKYIKF